MTWKGLVKAGSDNSNHILTAIAVAGVVTTAYLAAKAGPISWDMIESKKELLDEGEELTKFEEFKASWTAFIPAGIAGGITIACIIGANTVSTRRQAALLAGAGIAERAFAEYRDQVIEKIGDKKEEEIRAAVKQKAVEANPPTPEVLINQGDKTLCLEPWSNRYFLSTKQEILKAVNDVNFQVLHDNYASMNDFYRYLGLATISNADEWGFNTDQKMDIYFTSVLTSDDQPVLAFDFHNSPIKGYYKVNPFH